jgi:hypothetical protein
MAHPTRPPQATSPAPHRSKRRSPDVQAKQSPSERQAVAREWEQQGHEWEAEGQEHRTPEPGAQEKGYGQTRQGYEWERPEKGKRRSRSTTPSQTPSTHDASSPSAKKQ